MTFIMNLLRVLITSANSPWLLQTNVVKLLWQHFINVFSAFHSDQKYKENTNRVSFDIKFTRQVFENAC